MSKIPVELPDHLMQFVDQGTKEGGFANPSDYILPVCQCLFKPSIRPVSIVLPRSTDQETVDIVDGSTGLGFAGDVGLNAVFDLFLESGETASCCGFSA